MCLSVLLIGTGKVYNYFGDCKNETLQKMSVKLKFKLDGLHL